MENRYDKILRENNRAILDLMPGERLLRRTAAKQVQNRSPVLEIGCGEGDLTGYLLGSDKKVDALDISYDMINAAIQNFPPELHPNIHYIHADALHYLRRTDKMYEAVISAWTFHNFKRQDRPELYKAVIDRLEPGGALVLMDKLYPSSYVQGRSMLLRQLKRYDWHLQPEVAQAITHHEEQDYLPDYRMTKSGTGKHLREAGFRDVTIVDRVERDVVLVAKK